MSQAYADVCNTNKTIIDEGEMMRKLVCMIIVSVMLLGVSAAGLAGCVKSGIDPTKTQLYVGNFDGGLGHAWLDELARQFEAIHKEESFEPGKTGIQVITDNDKDRYADDRLLNSMESYRQDIFFTPALTYQNFVKAGVVADITDTVEEKYEKVIDEDGEKLVSIVDKMDSTLSDYYKIDKKYYAIPFYVAPYGIIYDKDLFAEYGYYDDGFGPDGIEGNKDDGLPATFEDFKVLLNQMLNDNITPFTWSGKETYQRQWGLVSVWANYEGKKNYNLNTTFDGVYNAPKGVTGEMKDLKITLDNGYMLQKQYGKLAALTFAREITSNSRYYSPKSMLTSHTHMNAQEEFIYSIRATKENRIAMLIEGAWWENEGRGTFEAMSRFGERYSYGARNFGLLPIPRFIGTAGVPDQNDISTNTFFASGESTVMINANTEKMPARKKLARMFLQHTTSNDSMGVFTKHTGNPRPYAYDIAPEMYSQMTPFAQDLWDYYRHGNADMVFDANFHMIRANQKSDFTSWAWGISQPTYNEPINAFTASGESKNWTAYKYFEKLSEYNNKSKWEDIFRQF